MTNDPFGYKLLHQRLKTSHQVIQSILKTAKIPSILNPSNHFTVTGVGSSEAHARFFALLINQYTTSTAIFEPLSNFLHPIKKSKKHSTLVLFSQGLSPNSFLALKQRTIFKNTILFTAIDTNSQHTEKVRILNDLETENATIVNIPTQDEYGLLLRIIGPLAAYLIIIQFIQKNWETTLPYCSDENISSAIIEAKNHLNPPVIADFSRDLKKGSLIISSPPTSEYAQNLAYKLMEGLFVPQPAIVDILSFPHGHFQELCKNPKPVILLDSTENNPIFDILQELIIASKAPFLKISSSLPHPYSILEYEATLNHLVDNLMMPLQVNQVDWPGKNLDLAMYNIKNPL